MSRVRSAKLLGAGVIVGLVVASSFALGQQRSASNELVACVQSDNTLRLAGRSPCAAGERLVTWAVQGPEGPPGARGLQGPPGPAGPVGTINNLDWDSLPYLRKDRFSDVPALPTAVSPASTGPGCMLGEVRMFAGNYAPQGWSFALGQQVSNASNTALASILGTTYGGDGHSTFALPSLGDLRPSGVGYIICTGGTMPPRGN